MKVTILLLLATLAAAQENAELSTFVRNYTDYTARLLSAIYDEKPGNFYITPYSAYITFGLLRDGAREETAQEIKEYFGFPPEPVDELINAIILLINDYMRGFKSIFVSKNYQINDRIKEIGEKFYTTGVENLDFSDTKAAAARINGGVAAQTREVIRDIIKASELNPDGKLYTISAEAYQGRFQLDQNATLTEADFHVDSKKTRKSAAVNLLGTFNYYEDTNLKIKAVEIPLEGEDLYFRIVIPTDIEGLKELEAHTEELLHISKFSSKKVFVTFPKFTVTSTWHQECLTESMPTIFSEGDADLSGIAGDPKELYLNYVTQKVYIRVNEYGLEIPEDPSEDSKIRTGSISAKNPAIKEFKADHPFFFYIRQGDVFHFVGRLTDPTEDTSQS